MNPSHDTRHPDLLEQQLQQVLAELGEGHGDAPEVVQSYIGTSPFDHINDETSLALGTACYDLMGQAVGRPCWRLFGEQLARRWVPVSSWAANSRGPGGPTLPQDPFAPRRGPLDRLHIGKVA